MFDVQNPTATSEGKSHGRIIDYTWRSVLDNENQPPPPPTPHPRVERPHSCCRLPERRAGDGPIQRSPSRERGVLSPQSLRIVSGMSKRGCQPCHRLPSSDSPRVAGIIPMSTTLRTMFAQTRHPMHLTLLTDYKRQITRLPESLSHVPDAYEPPERLPPHRLSIPIKP